jgi:hypothetical protein
MHLPWLPCLFLQVLSLAPRGQRAAPSQTCSAYCTMQLQLSLHPHLSQPHTQRRVHSHHQVVQEAVATAGVREMLRWRRGGPS